MALLLRQTILAFFTCLNVLMYAVLGGLIYLFVIPSSESRCERVKTNNMENNRNQEIFTEYET